MSRFLLIMALFLAVAAGVRADPRISPDNVCLKEIEDGSSNTRMRYRSVLLPVKVGVVSPTQDGQATLQLLFTNDKAGESAEVLPPVSGKEESLRKWAAQVGKNGAWAVYLPFNAPRKRHGLDVETADLQVLIFVAIDRGLTKGCAALYSPAADAVVVPRYLMPELTLEKYD